MFTTTCNRERWDIYFWVPGSAGQQWNYSMLDCCTQKWHTYPVPCSSATSTFACCWCISTCSKIARVRQAWPVKRRQFQSLSSDGFAVSYHCSSLPFFSVDEVPEARFWGGAGALCGLLVVGVELEHQLMGWLEGAWQSSTLVINTMHAAVL